VSIDVESGLTAEQLLGVAAAASDRQAWASAIWEAFLARAAILEGQGLLTRQEAERGAWDWIEARMPPAPRSTS